MKTGGDTAAGGQPLPAVPGGKAPAGRGN